MNISSIYSSADSLYDKLKGKKSNKVNEDKTQPKDTVEFSISEEDVKKNELILKYKDGSFLENDKFDKQFDKLIKFLS